MNKFILITGSNGLIGSSLVEQFLEEKYNIIATYHKNKDKLLKIKKNHKNLVLVKFDPQKPSNFQKLFLQLNKKKFKVSTAINSMVIRPSRRGMNNNINLWKKSISINSDVTYFFCKFFCQYFRKNKITGSLINIGSIYSNIGPDFNIYKNENFELEPDYLYNKFGMLGLTKYFASKYGKYNIRVNMVSPGGIVNNQSKSFIKKYSSKTFLKRMGNKTDIYGLVKYLSTDESSYMTGQNLILDGGYVSN